MQYQIVAEESEGYSFALASLEKKVKLLMQNDWKPQGGLSIAYTDYEWCIAAQAMIKED